MKLSVLKSVALSAAFACAISAAAIPAKRGVHNIVQPDGTTLSVVIEGDERAHTYTTADGYLLRERDDVFYYADAQGAPTTLRATNAESRSANVRKFLDGIDRKASVQQYRELQLKTPARAPRANVQGPGLFPGTQFPAQGSQKVLVVLVQYTNVKFQVSNPADFYYRQLNQEGYSDYGATGSARDFFIKGSMGQFTPQMDVYGPITLKNNQAYYGGNDWSGNDKHPEEMVIEACQQLDATVDFSEYDRDGDGYIDNVYVIYAGKGEADGGGSSTVWPHSWDISAATNTPYYFDGKRLDRYACSNEWDNYENRPDGIGTFVHEFSHVMGLPDLYSTSYSSAHTPGAYSVMDYGPYNNDGRTPPTFSAFERYALGWIDPIEINGPLNGEMSNIHDSNKAYIIKTSSENEYFLLENRQQTGWDTFIPGHGMLVWHIDYNDDVWTDNTVNNSASHQYVDIEEADGKADDATMDGDPFPGTKNKIDFTDDTNPNMRTWSGKRLERPITFIAESPAGVITFLACGGVVDLEAVSVGTPCDITSESFRVDWSEVAGATSYIVNLQMQRQGSADRLPVAAYTNLNVGNVLSYTFSGLEPETTYFLTVTAEAGGNTSEPSAEVQVATAALTFEYSRIALLPATNITGHSATLNWEPRDEADDYLVDVYMSRATGTETHVVDFTGGVNELPDGWTTNSTTVYDSGAYSGQSTPSLKLQSDGAYLQSPEYSHDIVSLKFWMRGANADSRNHVNVMALTNGQWTDLVTLNISNGTSGSTPVVEPMPQGTRAIRLVYEKTGKGNVAVDDVELTVVGGEVERTPVGGYTAYSTGGASTLDIAGLEPMTTYNYSVVGLSGEVRSLPSYEGIFTTTDSSSIETPATTAATISSDARGITVAAEQGTPITICDAMGRTVARDIADGNARRYSVAAGGLYIVKVGTQAVKTICR